VAEPVLTINIGGEDFVFMADIGAMVSFIRPAISKAQMRPCDVQARGVTGTQLDILGEQEVEFSLRSKDGDMTFLHTFVVSPLKRRGSGNWSKNWDEYAPYAIMAYRAMPHCSTKYSPYKGPFQVEQKISPLIYKVRLTDGSSVVLHKIC
jgi:hypothetical protein